jgi:hypothetical protein
MPQGRRRTRGRHAARRSHRRLVMLLLGLAVSGGTAVFVDSPRHHHPPAAHSDLTATDLDAQRASEQNEVSRGQARVAAQSAPTSQSASPRPRLTPVAGLSLTQTANVALIVEVTRRRNLPRQAAVVAVATALQESNLHNVASSAVPESLKYPHDGVSVNLDSIGLFQQRPSQGWGTVAQLMDPRYATGVFYDRLVKVAGWQNLSVTDAAQAVQRSAFPGAYQKHEDTARAAVAAVMP